MGEPSKESLDKMWKFVKGFAEKSGTTFHPNRAVAEAVSFPCAGLSAVQPHSGCAIASFAGAASLFGCRACDL